MDPALWPIIVFAIKLPVVGSMALLIAVTLWMVEHALRHGAVFETKPGPIRTRAGTPLRYWLYIVWQLLFVAAIAVMIHVIIQFGEPRDPPGAFASTARAAPKASAPRIIGPATVRLIESKVVMPGGADGSPTTIATTCS